MTDSTTTTRVTSIRTVGVPVRDQDRALEFYTGVLGLRLTMNVELSGGRRWIEVAPAAGGTTIALVTASPSALAGVETGIRLCTPDADALHAHLLEHGTSADDVLRWPGVPPMFSFRDQDGNGLEVVAES
jgi:catechol 2,3-dioxygenase-like lactoylglutathione lyase family enzyme